MTAPHAASYNIPADWQQFERLCEALMSTLYGKRFDSYGRGGQRQDGVDAYCRLDDGRLIAIQCKGRSGSYGKPLTPKGLDDAVAETATFPHEIDLFLVLTTGPHDRKLIDHALIITEQRQATNHCPVEIWGWHSIENLIRQHKDIQDAFYPHFKPQVSSRHWAFRAGLAAALMLTSVIGVHQYFSYENKVTLQRDATNKGLDEFITLNEELIDIYDRCLGALNNNVFTFSYEFQQFCTVPVEKKLKAIELHVKQAGVKINAQAFDQLNELLGLLQEDYRQGLVTVMMTQAFEDGMIRSHRALCPPANQDVSTEILKGLRAPAEDAEIQQLQFYFTLRDFILPGLRSMQANVLVAARQNNNQSVSELMLAQARELSKLLSQRHNYELVKPESPFSLSAVKSRSARSITISGDAGNYVEDARYSEILLKSISASYYGRPNEAQEMIACGVFKTSAKEQLEQHENDIRSAASTSY
ncbi:hypothetical protein I5J93_25260 [Pseudomonas aeruginosa]|uniref:hypothetical protein n=1 Tax=Pseudomonas aeruginosa TaxID=287 RepID=UPI001067A1A6|nr:hypothetical protein [Pseudomonas aeruginosa]MBH8864128.1 hypothetical protein [Pseudomonas aeruginosa]TEQ15659.1 hypothetical protein IPC58_28965 [Pseudomonas aeruginosa]HDY6082177.1 hypothetical protein [Pseudomonas aeruginosa]HEP9030594.1 hypothetical protein [Pseudomonas aeruginosa]